MGKAESGEGRWGVGVENGAACDIDAVFRCFVFLPTILLILWKPGPQKTLSRPGGMPLSLTILEIHILYSTVVESRRPGA